MSHRGRELRMRRHGDVRDGVRLITHRFTYELVVDWDDDGCTARIDGDDSPLRGHGSSPILALAELVKALVEWPQGGANRWLNTPSGVQLARMFVPGFEPDNGAPSA